MELNMKKSIYIGSEKSNVLINRKKAKYLGVNITGNIWDTLEIQKWELRNQAKKISYISKIGNFKTKHIITSAYYWSFYEYKLLSLKKTEYFNGNELWSIFFKHIKLIYEINSWIHWRAIA
jgi:hypothetical protein